MHFHLLRGDGRGKGARVTRNTASQAHGHSELQALSAGPVNTDRGCVQERVPYILKAASVFLRHRWLARHTSGFLLWASAWACSSVLACGYLGLKTRESELMHSTIYLRINAFKLTCYGKNDNFALRIRISIIPQLPGVNVFYSNPPLKAHQASLLFYFYKTNSSVHGWTD